MHEAQILTSAQMRASEQAIFDSGTSQFELMEVAAHGAAEWIRRIAAGRSVTVFCGPGNNGGDGYVIARLLREAGNSVEVVAPSEPKTDAAKRARELWNAPVLTSGGSVDADVFVDCLFGTGLTRPLSGEHALLLRDLAKRHDTLIAVDLPSGIDSDSGALFNERLPDFDVTLALGAWKFAHCLLPGRAKMGTQRMVSIGIDAVDSAASRALSPQITPPAFDSHKYKRGFALVIGGDMPGAALLAAQSAMRAGAGYVKLSAHNTAGAPPDLVVDSSHQRVALDDSRLDAVLIGPGLGRHEGSQKALEEAIACGVNLVLDADALHLVSPHMTSGDQQMLATPHDGELEVLCRKYAVIGDSRMARAKSIAAISGMTICAKGPDTVIAAPDGRVVIGSAAPSWLSIAGSGDVLAGVALSRMAAGKDPFEAACDAVWLHGEAARISGPALTPLDLVHALPAAIAKCLR